MNYDDYNTMYGGGFKDVLLSKSKALSKTVVDSAKKTGSKLTKNIKHTGTQLLQQTQSTLEHSADDIKQQISEQLKPQSGGKYPQRKNQSEWIRRATDHYYKKKEQGATIVMPDGSERPYLYKDALIELSGNFPRRPSRPSRPSPRKPVVSRKSAKKILSEWDSAY
jgi:hypothetical protein